MSDTDALKAKIIEFLGSLEGKGAEKTVTIAKAVGVKRKQASKLLVELEAEGKVVPAGVAAGVAGYKLVK